MWTSECLVNGLFEMNDSNAPYGFLSIFDFAVKFFVIFCKNKFNSKW